MWVSRRPVLNAKTTKINRRILLSRWRSKDDSASWERQAGRLLWLRGSAISGRHRIYQVFLMMVSMAKPPLGSRVALTATRGETWYWP